MKILPVSDLHLEHWAPNHGEVLKAIPSGVADVLVLAGDIVTMSAFEEEELEEIFRGFAAKARKRTVFVPGNHEYYNAHAKALDAFMKGALGKWGIDLLLPDAKSIVEVDGRRILGTTLWFPYQNGNERYQQFLSDFHVIGGFKSWVYEQFPAAKQFLSLNVRPGDIVVTHHLPTMRSIAKEYAGSQLNRFFVGEVDDVIAAKQPALWIHGHTHAAFDYHIGPTRIVCNPLGYPQEATRSFDERKFIDI